MGRGTRICTTLIDAGQLGGTFRVLCTFWFRFRLGQLTLHVGITQEAWTAFALGLMTTSHTEGIGGAGFLFTNRSADTIQTIAGLVICTILVVLTVSSDAGHEGTALSASWALADSLVILWQALGSTAATHLSMCAGIDAVLVQASLVVRTIGIDLALGWKGEKQEFITGNHLGLPSLRTYVCNIALEDHLPSRRDRSKLDVSSAHDTRHCRRKDWPRHKDPGSVD